MDPPGRTAATAEVQVASVATAGVDGKQHLAVGGRGLREVLDLEPRSAVPDQSPHRLLPSDDTGSPQLTGGPPGWAARRPPSTLRAAPSIASARVIARFPPLEATYAAASGTVLIACGELVTRDRATTLRDHLPDGGAVGEVDAGEVHVDHAAPLVQLGVGDRLGQLQPRVGVHHVDAAVPGEHGVEDRQDRSLVGDVALVELGRAAVVADGLDRGTPAGVIRRAARRAANPSRAARRL
jgi:hypothetical protein